MTKKMIIINGVTAKTLEEDQVDDTVASLKTVLPDANIVVIDVLDPDTPADNLGQIE